MVSKEQIPDNTVNGRNGGLILSVGFCRLRHQLPESLLHWMQSTFLVKENTSVATPFNCFNPENATRSTKSTKIYAAY